MTRAWDLRIPPGERPAVLVIDMQHDFCDPDAPTTLWPSIERTYEPIKQLLQRGAESARLSGDLHAGPCGGRRLIGRTLAFQTEIHAEMRIQIEGSHGAAIIAALAPHPGDRVIRNGGQAPFFSTDLEVFLARPRYRHPPVLRHQRQRLRARQVTDAFMRDIRCMVVRDCVADRTAAVFEANLFDLHQKYAEVVGFRGGYL